MLSKHLNGQMTQVTWDVNLFMDVHIPIPLFKVTQRIIYCFTRSQLCCTNFKGNWLVQSSSYWVTSIVLLLVFWKSDFLIIFPFAHPYETYKSEVEREMASPFITQPFPSWPSAQLYYVKTKTQGITEMTFPLFILWGRQSSSIGTFIII